MNKKTFTKTLSANDVGATGAHQAGILVPKTDNDLLAFLPSLDPKIKNPDAWIECKDDAGDIRRFRFVYYNNRLHDSSGTRNEYRLTYMTSYFKGAAAREGDTFEISRKDGDRYYSIRVIRSTADAHEAATQPIKPEEERSHRIKITSSWRRVH